MKGWEWALGIGVVIGVVGLPVAIKVLNAEKKKIASAKYAAAKYASVTNRSYYAYF